MVATNASTTGVGISNVPEIDRDLSIIRPRAEAAAANQTHDDQGPQDHNPFVGSETFQIPFGLVVQVAHGAVPPNRTARYLSLGHELGNPVRWGLPTTGFLIGLMACRWL